MLYPLSYGHNSLVVRLLVDSTFALLTQWAVLKMVGVEGFELSTSSSQSWRATRLRYTPKNLLVKHQALKNKERYWCRQLFLIDLSF